MMTLDRYDFEQDTMEPSENGTWVAFEDVKHLLEQRSLRDWFAGQALAGILAFPGAVDNNRDKSKEVCVRVAYSYADAMLAERSK